MVTPAGEGEGCLPHPAHSCVSIFQGLPQAGCLGYMEQGSLGRQGVWQAGPGVLLTEDPLHHSSSRSCWSWVGMGGLVVRSL